MLKINLKGTVKQVGTVSERRRERLEAWLKGDYKPHLRIIFTGHGKASLTEDPTGYHRKQLRIV